MSVDIALYLETNGFGLTAPPGSAQPTIYADTYPATPNNIVSVYDQSPFDPERAMGRVVMEVRNLQVLVRNGVANTAAIVAMNIWKLLDSNDKGARTINGTVYYSILGRGMPIPLGPDENNRWRWSANFQVRKDIAV